MSKFKLYIKHQKDLIPLTIYDSNDNGVFSAATYDESVKFETNNYFELTFKLSYYINRPSFAITKDSNNKISQVVSNDNKIENPFVKALQSGTVLRLVDKNNDVWDCIITSVKYNFHPDNIEIEYTASDIFAYQMSRRAMGYTIQNDEENTIGALPFDSWAIKIKKECNINWTYNPVDSINETIIRLSAFKNNTDSDKQTFNEIKSFDVSNSNAYDALKKLGEAYGLQIKLNYEQQSFGFIPTKNPINRGFYLTPNVNLKALDISTDAQSQTTMLNVTGATDSLGNEISILGVIPPVFLTWFGGAILDNEKAWDNTQYYSFSKGETVNVETLEALGFSAADFGIATLVDHTFNNNCNLYSDFLARYYWKDYRASLIEKDSSLSSIPENFSEDMFSIFSMPITETERTFLGTIEAVPYLENKLIDISYFKDTSILTPTDYAIWYKKIYDDLRIANGKLQFEVNTKLKQESRKISMITSCKTSIDKIESDVNQAIELYVNGTASGINFSADFAPVYNSIYQDETGLGNISDLVKQYESNWDKNDQSFLKNIYDFEQYFSAPTNLSISAEILNLCSELVAENNNIVNKNIYEDYWEISIKEAVGDKDALIATCTFNFQNSNFSDAPVVINNTFNSFLLEYLTDYKDIFYIKIEDGTSSFDSQNLPVNTLCGTYIPSETISFSGITTYNQKTAEFKVDIYAKAKTASGAFIKIRQISLLGAFNEAASINNGNYYAQNYSNSNYLTVIKCAEISSNLSGYWDVARKSGMLAGYWLPDTWTYIFSKNLSASSRYQNYEFCPLLKNSAGDIYINNGFLPEVRKIDETYFTISSTSDTLVKFGEYAYNTNETTYCKYSWIFDTPNNMEAETSWFNLEKLISSQTNSNSYVNDVSLLMPKYSGISFVIDTTETGKNNEKIFAINGKKLKNTDLQWFYQPLIGFNETRYIACRPKELIPPGSEAKFSEYIYSVYNTDEKAFMRCSLRGILNEYNRNKNLTHITSDLSKYNWFEDTSDYGGNKFYYLDGESPMLFRFVFKIYANQHYNDAYLKAKEKVKNIWSEIYTNYDNLLIENTYEDTSSLTPSLLLKAARQKFQELREPEPNYNVSMLDVYNDDLQLNGKLIISDQIGLSLSETDFVVGEDRSYTEYIIKYDDNYITNSNPTGEHKEVVKYNKLKQLIMKTLFVTEISYSLRQDQAVTITVNPVRYSDVMLDRLVKLL